VPRSTHRDRRPVPNPVGRLGDDGQVAVDAMVALVILGLCSVLSLRAIEVAHKVVASADEARRARALIMGLLDSGPRTFTDSSGSSLGFSWTLQTRTTGLDRPVAVCRRAVSLVSPASGRTFAASTFEPCPAEAAA
jgi:hypothetical protein